MTWLVSSIFSRTTTALDDFIKFLPSCPVLIMLNLWCLLLRSWIAQLKSSTRCDDTRLLDRFAFNSIVSMLSSRDFLFTQLDTFRSSFYWTFLSRKWLHNRDKVFFMVMICFINWSHSVQIGWLSVVSINWANLSRHRASDSHFHAFIMRLLEWL